MHFPGSGVDQGGNPDAGEGWYSKKLEYADWVKFASAMRCYTNWIQAFPQYVLLTLIASLYFPIPALAAIWTITFGRIVYVAGYVRQPKYMMIGYYITVPADIMIITLSITSAIISAVRYNTV